MDSLFWPYILTVAPLLLALIVWTLASRDTDRRRF